MYQSNDEVLAKRQLESQSITVVADLATSTGSSDLPSKLTIDNSTIGATVVTLDLEQAVGAIEHVHVLNKATGAIVAFGVAPAIAATNTITFTVNGTGLTSLFLKYQYRIA